MNMIAIRNRIANDFRFLKGWVKEPKSVGSIKPTSKLAAELMVSFVPKNSESPVLELGPGTGPITKTILGSGVAPHRLVSVEYNADFCKLLRRAYPGVTIVEGDAFDLSKTLADYKGTKFSAILSGLPLLNFPPEKREKYIEDALDWLEPDASLVQLCYGPRAPVKNRPGSFSSRRTKWVLSNVPPARFWIYKDERVNNSDYRSF